MDNIVPFLAPNKVNQMIETALAKQQMTPQRRNSVSAWRFAGMGIAACFALLMVFGGAQQQQMDHMVAVGEPIAMVAPSVQKSEIVQVSATDDQEDTGTTFYDFVMLETLEPY